MLCSAEIWETLAAWTTAVILPASFLNANFARNQISACADDSTGGITVFRHREHFEDALTTSAIVFLEKVVRQNCLVGSSERFN